MAAPSSASSARSGNIIGYGFFALVLLIIIGVAVWITTQQLAAARSPVQAGRVQNLYPTRRAHREPEFKAALRYQPAGATDSIEVSVTVSAWLYLQLRPHDVLPIQAAPGSPWMTQLAGDGSFEWPTGWWLPPTLLALGILLLRRQRRLVTALGGGIVLWGLGLFAYTAWLDTRYQLYRFGEEIPLTLTQLDPPAAGQPARATLQPTAAPDAEASPLPLRADEYAYLFVSQHRATPLPLRGRRPWLGAGPARWDKQLDEIRRAAPGYGEAVFWLAVGGGALYWLRRRSATTAAANIPAAS